MNDNDQASMESGRAPAAGIEPAPVALSVQGTGAAGTAAREELPLVIRGWRRMRREPSLLLPMAYLFVSFIGLWANYWFYEGFELPILEYMQASDYLVAGLRDPAYALVLLAMFALSVLISAPDIYRRHHPERAEAWRRKWWGRVVFPENRWLRWKGFGLAPETGVTCAVICGMLWATLLYVQSNGDLIRGNDTGNPVRVTMPDGSLQSERQPQPSQG